MYDVAVVVLTTRGVCVRLACVVGVVFLASLSPSSVLGQRALSSG